MDFWNDDVKDGFDRMFDFDHDGKLNLGERAAQFEYMEEEEREIESSYDNDFDDDDFDDDDDDFDDDDF